MENKNFFHPIRLTHTHIIIGRKKNEAIIARNIKYFTEYRNIIGGKDLWNNQPA
ncbi:MAG: hypothetical protein JSV93_00930 [Candidatus Omnitrophota bacterium]|nr:MAG: hypothetical protein JSV93_00930 [Candidatus Omnitrophota bacterium]